MKMKLIVLLLVLIATKKIVSLTIWYVTRL